VFQECSLPFFPMQTFPQRLQSLAFLLLSFPTSFLPYQGPYVLFRIIPTVRPITSLFRLRTHFSFFISIFAVSKLFPSKFFLPPPIVRIEGFNLRFFSFFSFQFPLFIPDFFLHGGFVGSFRLLSFFIHFPESPPLSFANYVFHSVQVVPRLLPLSGRVRMPGSLSPWLPIAFFLPPFFPSGSPPVAPTFS